jgi:hypothetical protein
VSATTTMLIKSHRGLQAAATLCLDPQSPDFVQTK